MPKAKPALPHWVRNLRLLMEQRDYNPRSLSLKAGLNPTAVRDMLEGRTRFPRYDTAQALAKALQTTPAILMGSKDAAAEAAQKNPQFGQDLELLTEIIARLQEVVEEHNRRLPPRDFAAMAAAIYRRMQDGEAAPGAIRPAIYDLLDYEKLRQRGRR